MSDKESKAESKVGASALSVFSKDKFGNESLVRTYSVAQHGDRFKEYAEEFAAKKGYSVRKA